MLSNVWRSSQYSTKTKLRLYQSCILSTLLYGSECWRMTESDLNKLSTFHTENFRTILRVVWPETIYNQHLARCNQDSMGTIIMRRRWRWIGHVMRREPGNISRRALHWTPEKKRKRGRIQEHLASNCGRGAQDPPSHLGDRSEADPKQTGVGCLCCCPTYQPA